MMALIFDNIPATNGNQNQQPPGAPPQDEGAAGADDGRIPIFQAVPTEIGEAAVETVGGLLSGEGLEAARAKTSEALARAAKSLRLTAGEQFAPVLGQGAALRAQQEVEQGIFAEVAQTQLGFAELEQKMKERGVGMAIELERLGDVKFAQRLNAVDFLLEQGGEANFLTATEELNSLFPGMDFDFSRAIQTENVADFRAGMSFLTDMVASGIGIEQAMGVASQQGLEDLLGMDAGQMGVMYSELERQGNPMLATIDEIRAAGFEEDVTEAMLSSYLQNLTGMEMEQDDAGNWHVVPPDGYTKVFTLNNITPGDMIKFEMPLFALNGNKIPPGKYHAVEVVSHTAWDKNGWTGEKTRDTATNLVLVSEEGLRYTVKTVWSEDTKSANGGGLDPMGIFS
jgi:hypothetical protein